MEQQNIVSWRSIILVNEPNSERKLLEFICFVARVFTSSVPFMSYCRVGVEGICFVLFFFFFCKFQPSDQAFPAFFDQVILLGSHPLVIIKTVCWVFLSCQCYGSLCKLICSSQCLSFVKQCACFFRFLLWP